MIWFYVTFSPNKAGYFIFKDTFKIIQKLVFSYYNVPIDLCVEASENLSLRF